MLILYAILQAIDTTTTIIAVCVMGGRELHPVAAIILAHTGALGWALFKAAVVAITAAFYRGAPKRIRRWIMAPLNVVYLFVCTWNVLQFVLV